MSVAGRSLATCFAVAALSATVGTSTAWAQFTSSMEGTIVDPAGARIPGAAVVIANNATGVKNTTQTNSVGYFLFPSLPPGTFSMTVSSAGFKTSEVSNLLLELDQRRTINLTMEVGTQATTLSVKAEAVSVDLSEVRLAGTFETRQLTELPMSQQSFMALVSLTAGITGNGANDPLQAEAQINISANGQRGEQNGFAVDSGTVTSMVRHGRTNMQPNIEAIQEMQVTVNNFSPESATDAGVNVNVVTKGGTNAYHGSLAWYHQNNLFQSRTLFQNVPNAATGRIIAPSRRNEPQGSFGGPVIKNKFFLFGTFDIVHRLTGQTGTQTVETPEFASLVKQNFPSNKSAFLFSKYPSVITPYRDFRTVGTMLDDQGVNRTGLLSSVACSGLASPSALVSTGIGDLPCNMRVEGGGVSPISTSLDAYQWSTRGDYQISNNDRFYASVFRTAEKSYSGSTSRPAFSYIYPTWNWFGNINETHTFSSRILNEFRATVTRVHGEIQCRECDIPSMNTGNNGFAGFGMGGPTPFMQNNYEYRDTLSIIRGGHSIRGGIQFSFLQSNWKPTAGYTRPTFNFLSIADWVNDIVNTESNVGLNPKDGSPYTPDVAERQHTQGWFLQDTWKVKPNLTLTYGLRWEYYGTVNQATEGNNVQWVGGDNLWTRIASGANVTRYHILDHGDKNNYAPRLSVAWDPFGRGNTSIRAGIGVFYDFLPSQLYGGAHFTPPIYLIINNIGSQTAPLLPVYSFGAAASKNDYDGRGVPYQFQYPAGLQKAIGLNAKNGSTYAPASITWIDPSLKSSYTPSWTFGIQQVLTPTMSIDLNYVGNTGRKLYAKYDVNRFAGDLLQPGREGIITRINDSFGSISYGQSNFTSAYNGLNATVRKRLSHGVMFNVAYTLGHAISLSDSFGVNPTDPWNLDLDRGSTGVPQKLASSFIYEAPFLNQGPKAFRAAINGWQMSGVFVVQAGGYFSVNCGNTQLTYTAATKTTTYNCDYNADGTANERALVPAFGNKLDLSRESMLVNGVFKIADFPAPAPGSLTGMMAKDFFRGIGSWNLDLAASRNFKLPWLFGEKATLQIRGEAFNAPNRVNLGGISSTLTSATFGKVTSANNARAFAVNARLSF